MTTITNEVFAEESYDLIQRLKDINAVIKRNSSLIDRYAGVSELALFRDIRKVGVLSRILFDPDLQIRRLAAQALEKQYKYGETSNLILELLEKGQERLHEIYISQNVDQLILLLLKADSLLRQGKEVDMNGDIVNAAGRHVCIILERLSHAFHEILHSHHKHGDHPLKQILETNLEVRKLKERIFELAFESKDVFCRRDAIVLIGELSLTRTLEEDPFDLILTLINDPKDRNNYLVTRDGIAALTRLVVQDPDYKQRYNQVIESFYLGRSYDVLKQWERENYPHHTRNDCIEALHGIGDFESIEKLMKMGEKQKVIRMMVPEEPYTTTTRVKTQIVASYLDWYRQVSQSHPDELTETQKQILEQIKTWLYSEIRDIRIEARNSLSSLPNSVLALQFLHESGTEIDRELSSVLRRIQISGGLDNSTGKEEDNPEPEDDSISENSNGEEENLLEEEPTSKLDKDASRLAKVANRIDLQAKEKLEKKIEDLYEDRQQLITASGTILLKSTPPADAVLKFLESLKEWGLDQRCLILSKKLRNAANQSRREALWMLYELSNAENLGKLGIRKDLVTLNDQELSSIQGLEDNLSIRCVLELFKSRLAPDPRNYLSNVIRSKQAVPVLACAEMEYSMLGRGSVVTFSANLLKFLLQEFIKPTIIHETFLLYRFIPFLAQSEPTISLPEDSKEVQDITQFIGTVIFDTNSSKEVKQTLRFHLSLGHCFRLRRRFMRSLLNNLRMRRMDSSNLRLDYLNLHRAGLYKLQNQKTIDEREESFFEDEVTSLEKKLFEGVQSIQLWYHTSEMPIKYQDENGYTIAELANQDSATYINILHATEGHNKLRAYLRKTKYPRGFIFLKKGYTDDEIFRQLQERKTNGAREIPMDGSSKQMRMNNSQIVAEVVQIEQNGCRVDVGLRNRTIFIDREQLVGKGRSTISDEDFHEELANLYGSILSLQIHSVTYERDEHGVHITDMNLSRAPELDEPEPQMKMTITATVHSVPGKEGRMAVNFDWEGKPISIPLEELSWRASPEWISDGWRKEFKIQKKYNLFFDGAKWSVKDVPPRRENFASLIYERGESRFEIVFIGSTQDGYEFELQPGKNCLIPSDRLQGPGENGKYQFALPSDSLKPHDVLEVRFVKDKIDEQDEVILQIVKVKPDLVTSELLRKGTNITGRIKGVFLEEHYVTMAADAPDLNVFNFKVQNLPQFEDTAIRLEIGSEISGYVVQVNRFENEVILNYKPAMPQDLELDKKYYCKVIGKNNTGLIVRYGNVVGTVDEKALTYSHMPVTFQYNKGNQLYVTLDKERHSDPGEWQKHPDKGPILEERFTATLRLRQEDPKVLSSAGLDTDQKKKKCQGIITGVTRNDIIQFGNDEGQYELPLYKFNISDVTRNLEFYPGNHLIVEITGTNQLKVTVQQAKIHFRHTPPIQKISGIAWDRPGVVLNPGQPVKCIYVGTRWLRQVDLSTCWFESENGEWFEALLSELNRSSDKRAFEWVGMPPNADLIVRPEGQVNYQELYPGDSLWLKLDDNNDIHVLKVDPGPLHQALGEDKASLPITARVITKRTDGTFLAELISVKKDGGNILLRQGLIGRGELESFAPNLKIRDEILVQLHDAPYVFFQNNFYRLGIEIDPFVLETQPNIEPTAVTPTAEKPTLPVAVASEQSSESPKQSLPLTAVPSAPPLPIPTHDDIVAFLENLRDKVEAEGRKTYRGRITGYNEQEKAFEVQLDTLKNIPCRCYLPSDEVSYSGTRRYDSINSFVEKPHNEFTFMTIESKKERVEISYRWNTPKDIQDAGDELEWQSGRELQDVTFVSEDSNTENVIIEVMPGFLVRVPWSRFAIDSVPYSRCDRKMISDGDTLHVRVKNTDIFSLNVLDFQLATMRRYANPRRIYYGSVGELDGGKIRIKLEGVPQKSVACYIDPAVIVSRESLVAYDLFRFSLYSKDGLYFKPVTVDELKRADIVQAKILEKLGSVVKVSFGNNRRGILYASQVSYSPDFDMQDFNYQEDDQIEVALSRDGSTKGPVRLTLKGLPPLSSGYFRIPSVKDELKNRRFSVVVVRRDQDRITVEVKPGIVVQLPFEYFTVTPQMTVQQEKIRDLLRPGDVLQLHIAYQKNDDFKLEIHGWIKSLMHYMKTNMLVRARFNDLYGQGNWMFDLLDFPERMGRLRINDRSSVPGIFSKDLVFTIKNIPSEDPTAAVELQQHTPNDAFILARIEEVENERVQVILENGERTFFTSYELTFRVDNKYEYLKNSLHEGDILTCSASVRNDNDNKTVRFRVTANEPYQAKEMLKFAGDTLDLTYVGMEADDLIFEITPGYFVRLPSSMLVFQGHPMHIDHLFCGDVITVRMKIITDQESDKSTVKPSTIGQYKVDVENIYLCSLHNLSGRHILLATVTDVIDSAFHKSSFGNRFAPAGVMVKAGSFEEFIPERDLLNRRNLNSYQKGNTVWLLIEHSLNDAPDNFSFREVEEQDLPTYKRNSSNEHRLLMRTEIIERQATGIYVDIMGERVYIGLWFLMWNITDDSFMDSYSPVASDLLLKDENFIWLEVGSKKDGSLGAYPKFVFSSNLREIQALASPVHLAQVLQFNKIGSQIKSILLSVNGMRLLVKNGQLVLGAPANLECLPINAVIPVEVTEAQYQPYDPKSQYLTISREKLNASLAESEVGKPIHGTVVYTLSHGLVFRSGEALGYISNDNIGWGENPVPAQVVFQPGQNIAVWPSETTDGKREFQVKHISQISDLQTDEPVSALIVGKSDTDVYLCLEKEVYAALPSQHLTRRLFETMKLSDTLIIDVDPDKATGRLNLIPHVDTNPTSEIAETMFMTAKNNFDLFYPQALKSLLDTLNRNNLEAQFSNTGQARGTEVYSAPGSISLLSKETNVLEDNFIGTINRKNIPCTYRNMRSFLDWLYQQPYLEILLKQMRRYVPTIDDSGTVYILCQLALAVNGDSLVANRKDLDGLVFYTIGLSSILGTPPVAVDASTALSYLTRALQISPVIDVKLVLLVLYEKLGLYDKRQQTFEDICTQIRQRLQFLIRLPRPVSLDLNALGVEGNRQIPRLNRTYNDVYREIDEAVWRYWNVNSLDRSYSILTKIKNDMKVANTPVFAEVNVDIAIIYILQGDLENAINILLEARDSLPKSGRNSFRNVKDVIYRLETYLFLQTGHYQQLYKLFAEMISKRYLDLDPRRDNEPDHWAHAMLSLAFLNQGNYRLSNEIIEMFPPQESSLPEYHFISLYWAYKKQSTPLPLPEMAQLQAAFMHDSEFGLHTQPEIDRKLHLIPDITGVSYVELVSIGLEYHLASYIIQKYNQESEFRKWVGDSRVAKGVAEMALQIGEARLAKEVMHNYLRMKVGKAGKEEQLENAARDITTLYRNYFFLSDWLTLVIKYPAVDWRKAMGTNVSVDQYNDFLRKASDWTLGKGEMPEELSLVKIISLFEYWINSEEDRPYIGKRLMDLTRDNNELAQVIWNNQESREVILRALNQSFDYASVTFTDEVLSGLHTDALENILFHWFLAGFKTATEQFLDHLLFQTTSKPKVYSYLLELQKRIVRSNARQFIQAMQILLSSEYGEIPQIEMLIRSQPIILDALELITSHPNPNHQAVACFLSGKLLETSGDFTQAYNHYAIILDLPDASLGNLKSLVYLRIIRLYLRDAITQDKIPSYPLGLREYDFKPKSIGRLIEVAAQVALDPQARIYRNDLALSLEYLEMFLLHIVQTGQVQPALLSGILDHLVMPVSADLIDSLYETVFNKQTSLSTRVRQQIAFANDFLHFAVRNRHTQLLGQIQVDVESLCHRIGEMPQSANRQREAELQKICVQASGLLGFLTAGNQTQDPAQFEDVALVLLDILAEDNNIACAAEAAHAWLALEDSGAVTFGARATELIVKILLRENSWVEAKRRVDLHLELNTLERTRLYKLVAEDRLMNNDLAAFDVIAANLNPDSKAILDKFREAWQKLVVNASAPSAIEQLRDLFDHYQNHLMPEFSYALLKRAALRRQNTGGLAKFSTMLMDQALRIKVSPLEITELFDSLQDTMGVEGKKLNKDVLIHYCSRFTLMERTSVTALFETILTGKMIDIDPIIIEQYGNLLSGN